MSLINKNQGTAELSSSDSKETKITPQMSVSTYEQQRTNHNGFNTISSIITLW